MNKKKIGIVIVMMVVIGLGFSFYQQTISDEVMPADDEIALHIQFDIEEDIGLIVLDYRADDHEFSGGMSNADRSLIKRDSDNIWVWNKQELNASSDTMSLSLRLRIITEYVDPNFENRYPEEITRFIDPISWEARFGNSYFVTITGNKTSGYKAVLN